MPGVGSPSGGTLSWITSQVAPPSVERRRDGDAFASCRLDSASAQVTEKILKAFIRFRKVKHRAQEKARREGPDNGPGDTTGSKLRKTTNNRASVLTGLIHKLFQANNCPPRGCPATFAQRRVFLPGGRPPPGMTGLRTCRETPNLASFPQFFECGPKTDCRGISGAKQGSE